MRTISEDEPLVINRTICDRMDKSTAMLEVSFNQEINPLTVNSDSLYIDGESLPPSSRFFFSKNGDTIKVVVPAPNDTFRLRVEGVESYSGITMEETEIQIEIIGKAG
ncbi:MAG: hypothetical protein K5930_12445 [Treponemataceae bacterium]|nr:hypothetical protein [Treponemataceae bacterium]